MDYNEILDAIESASEGYLHFTPFDVEMIYKNLLANHPDVYEGPDPCILQEIAEEVEYYYNS